MADGTQINPGSGGDIIATDEIAGVKYPRSKITLGADGENDGDVSADNPMPVEDSNLGTKLGEVQATPTTNTLLGRLKAIQDQLADLQTELSEKTEPTDTQNVSVSSLPLPTDAATATKQDTGNNTLTNIDSNIADINLVMGAKSDVSVTDHTLDEAPLISYIKGLIKIFADVWDSVNNRLKVDGSGVTQPVSGTVTANLSAPDNAVLDGINTNAGSTTDAAITSDTDGSLSSKLRGLVKIFADIWDSTNHFFKTSEATKLAGEDLTNDVIKVEERFLNSYISTATTTTVKSGAGFLHTITIGETAAGAITIYDSTTGSGSVIAVLKASIAEQTFTLDVSFATGLTIVTAGASKLSVSYR